PQEGRRPTPNHRDRRPDDGSHPGNRRVVMTEQDVPIRRDVIHPIEVLLARNRLVLLQLEDLVSQETRVKEVTGRKNRETYHAKQRRAHDRAHSSVPHWRRKVSKTRASAD